MTPQLETPREVTLTGSGPAVPRAGDDKVALPPFTQILDEQVDVIRDAVVIEQLVEIPELQLSEKFTLTRRVMFDVSLSCCK